jgi:hypothetical protein
MTARTSELALLSAIRSTGRAILEVESRMDGLGWADRDAIEALARAMALVGQAQDVLKASLPRDGRAPYAQAAALAATGRVDEAAHVLRRRCGMTLAAAQAEAESAASWRMSQ